MCNDKDAKEDCGKSDTSERSQDSTSQDSCGRPTKSRQKGSCRPGIDFKVGARLEARDFVDKWYASRIVEVDEEKKKVLIHFEGWSSRFDEWVDMNSPQLRPLTRTSTRKDPPKDHFHPEHKIGEKVLARWSDCRMYPGKIMSISNGLYDILFYDGLKKTVQAMNVKKMSPEALEKVNSIPPPTPTGEKKKRKLSDGMEPATKIAKIVKSSFSPTAGSTKGTPVKIKSFHSKSEERKPKISAVAKNKRKKLLVGGSFQAKRNRLDDKEMKIRRKTFNVGKWKAKQLKSPIKIAKAKLKKDGKMNKSNAPGKNEKSVMKESGKASKSNTKDATTKFSAKEKVNKETKITKEISSSASKEKIVLKESPAATIKDKSNKEVVHKDNVSNKDGKSTRNTSPNIIEKIVIADKESNIDLSSDPTLSMPKEQSGAAADVVNQTKLITQAVGEPSNCTQSSALMQILTSPVANIPPLVKTKGEPRRHKMKLGKAHALKNLLIDLDHNQFKCQVEGCGKGFRKQSLLESHNRHYHSIAGASDPVHLVRRKKRTLMSDSDSPLPVKLSLSPPVSPPSTNVTVSNRVKKKQIVSTIDITETLECKEKIINIIEDKLSLPLESSEDLKAELGHDESTMDTIFTNEDIGDDLRRDEIVHCVCGLNEENGFMMQCEICLCWQHGSCFNIHNEDNLPKKYFCYICQNPRGLRESFRFKHDHEWWRDGELTTFGFLPPKKRSTGSHMITLHNMVADVINVNSVLHGLRLKVDVAKNPKHTNLKLWAKPWTGNRGKRPLFHDGNISADDSLYDNADSSAVDLESSDIEIMDMKERIVVPSHLPHFDHMYSGRLPPPKVEVTPPPSITVEDVKSHIDLSESNPSAIKSSLGLSDVKQDSLDSDADDEEESQNSKESFSSECFNKDNEAGPSKAGTSVMECTNSPVPSNVKLTGNSIWMPVTKQKVVVETISEEEQYRICETNLLDHIMDLQDDLSFRLDVLEEQISTMEAELDHNQPCSFVDSSADLSQVKKTLRILISDLGKVKKLALFH